MSQNIPIVRTLGHLGQLGQLGQFRTFFKKCPNCPHSPLRSILCAIIPLNLTQMSGIPLDVKLRSLCRVTLEGKRVSQPVKIPEYSELVFGQRLGRCFEFFPMREAIRNRTGLVRVVGAPLGLA